MNWFTMSAFATAVLIYWLACWALGVVPTI
jgi:hypothetical protein